MSLAQQNFLAPASSSHTPIRSTSSRLNVAASTKPLAPPVAPLARAVSRGRSNVSASSRTYARPSASRVRLERVPCEFVDHLSPRRPVILGGLLPHEAAPPSLVTGRVRRHRWYGKVLKARDPVLFSCGWRRFQSAPLYSLEDERQTRSRYLKYTPEHMHCGATFWAPGIAPNSPLVGFHSLSSSSTTFRVSCVGVVLKQEATSKVSKKLKLCGAPYKVERNTAFVDGMFTSCLLYTSPSPRDATLSRMPSSA